LTDGHVLVKGKGNVLGRVGITLDALSGIGGGVPDVVCASLNISSHEVIDTHPTLDIALPSKTIVLGATNPLTLETSLHVGIILPAMSGSPVVGNTLGHVGVEGVVTVALLTSQSSLVKELAVGPGLRS